ncbi:MAG: hypothetical protein QNJ60_17885 [Xenococcaceae cyanobacterium MO_188.B19]|nr:hypothetical protein [Xenococcaceae cyanobacterium MO_188.B19]
MPKNGLEGIYKSVKDAAEKVEFKTLDGNIGIQIIQTKNKNDDGFVENIANIISAIRSSKVIVAVCVSEDKSFQLDPDVMYELGLAHALGKPLCIISSRENHHQLSDYILNDIPDDEFIDYELSEMNGGEAWRVYKQEYEGLYQHNKNAPECSKFKYPINFNSLQQSFNILKHGLSTTNIFPAKSHQEYLMLIDLIKDYPGSHELLSFTLDKEDIVNSLQRPAIINRVDAVINILIGHIDQLVYKRANTMMKNLGAMICRNCNDLL